MENVEWYFLTRGFQKNSIKFQLILDEYFYLCLFFFISNIKEYSYVYRFFYQYYK